jgi:hypothetical protein
MKKMVFGLALALAGLGFLMSPAMAAEPVQAAHILSAADQAFLASLAAPVGSPAPTPASRPPSGLEKATCTANCWDGSILSCTGSTCSGTNSNCGGGVRGSVTCDGTTTLCPSCCPDLNCAEERSLCESDCAGCPFTFSCSQTTCNVSCHCKFSGCF